MNRADNVLLRIRPVLSLVQLVAYLNHGHKRERVTVVGDVEKRAVKVYDANGDLVEPVLRQASTRKGE